MASGNFSETVFEMKEKVFVEEESVRYTSTMSDYDEFSIVNFLSNFSMKIELINEDLNFMIVDIIGIDTSIANALRRILLCEVPTVSISEVNIIQNTSIIQDEVLSHRLSLLPLNIDATIWPFVNDDNYNDNSNTIIFNLNVECNESMNKIVYSSDLKWIEQKGQKEFFIKNGFESNLPLKCVNDDIIIAQLRPGQCIEAWMKCVKGIGRNHAKFSPVGTAFYRLLPNIEINKILNINDAKNLYQICPKNVFDLTDISNKNEISQMGYLKVSRPRQCSMCRACISLNNSTTNVKLQRIKNHFIFEIESIGQYKVTHLLTQAIKILMNKCQTLGENIQDMKHRDKDKEQEKETQIQTEKDKQVRNENDNENENEMQIVD